MYGLLSCSDLPPQMRIGCTTNLERRENYDAMATMNPAFVYMRDIGLLVLDDRRMILKIDYHWASNIS